MTWLLLGIAALIIGISKTSFGGLASISVAMMALAMPTKTKESTAAALLLLITGDVVAVLRYRKLADWRLLRALLPVVIPGLLLGAWFLSAVDSTLLKRVIGVLLLIFVSLQLLQKVKARQKDEASPDQAHPALSVGAGIAAGFTTMAANAAGPVMALYLQLVGVEKLRFLGTSAWYFLIINVAKTPLTASLGLFTPEVLTVVVWLIPVVLVGTLLGIALVGKVEQHRFDIITLLTSVIAAVALLVS